MRARIIVAFVCGLVFSIGLCLSGMTQPQNIIGFLDVRHWNPALMLVMVGAVAVYGVGYRLALRRAHPAFAMRFDLPTQHDIDAPLVLGAILFGIGWGLGGFCNGPAIVALVSGKPEVLVFVAAMVVGTFIGDGWLRFVAARAAAAPAGH